MKKPLLWIIVAVIISITAVGWGDSSIHRANRVSAQINPASYLPTIFKKFNPGPGVVVGEVVNASNREPIVGASVCFYQLCAQTNVDGIYTLTDIPAGRKELEASASNYYTVADSITVLAYQTVTLNFALSELLGFGNVRIRIVLTWDSTPSWPPEGWDNDLDAHLWLEAPNPPTHVYYEGQSDCTTFPNACLEIDYRLGFGPETIALTDLELTTYHFGVLNYNQYRPGVPAITQTAANVKIYAEEGILDVLIDEFDVPTSGDGNFWYVFSILTSVDDDSGEVIGSILSTDCVTNYPGDELPTCGSQIELNNPLPRK